jgi:protein arginine N-methyltransferase 1
MSLVVDEHRQYLSDEARLSAFRQAIREVVKPGDVVVDLGSGTGIMGLLACQAGAKRVYSIEETGIIQLARELAQANGFENQVCFIKDLSTRATLPEPVDVVVADQIGRFGFDAGIFEYFSDARKRFLKPQGRTIPSRIDLEISPVEHQEMWNQIEFWNESPGGLRFHPARALAANTGYPVKYSPEQLLGNPCVLAALDPSRTPASIFGLQASVTVERAGTLHGIGGWFSAQLSEHVTLSNSPLVKERINRHNVFFPIDRPVPVTKGDRIQTKINILPADMVITWSVEVWGPAAEGQSKPEGQRKARFTHSTFQGMLLCTEDLHKTRPDFAPRLSSWGEARRSILELCDGRRRLPEIEQEVYCRHSELFRSPAEVAKFVAEVTNRYAL